MADAAQAKDMPVIIANPLLERRYAGAVGQLAKTDKIDARLIAEYAAVIRPEVRPASSHNVRAIKDLLARRRQLLSMSTRRRIAPRSCRDPSARIFNALSSTCKSSSRNWTSCSIQGKRRIRGGRHSVRTILFMAALTSEQHNPVIKRFFQHLVAQGKHNKVALTACIRKMIIMLNAMVRDGKVWKENMA